MKHHKDWAKELRQAPSVALNGTLIIIEPWIQQNQLTPATQNEAEGGAAVRSTDGLCFSSSRPWTWRDKLRCKLFPPQHCDLLEAPASFQDVLVCRVTSELSMLDRLRVLITGRIRVESRTVTENMMGSHRTKSIFSALPPKWWDREA